MTREETATMMHDMLHGARCYCLTCQVIRFALANYRDGLQLRRDVDARRSRETQEGAR